MMSDDQIRKSLIEMLVEFVKCGIANRDMDEDTCFTEQGELCLLRELSPDELRR